MVTINQFRRSVTYACLAVAFGLAAIASAPLVQQQAEKQISAYEAAKHVGSTATVCGEVASSRYAARSRGRPTFLNLEKPYPEQPFTVVIWGENRGKFKEAPEVAYRGKRICVVGVISTYRGTPQIVVDSPKQLRLAS